MLETHKAHVVKGAAQLFTAYIVIRANSEASETGLFTFLKCVFYIIMDLLKF